MTYKKATALLTFVLLAAPLHAAKKPAWVRGPDPAYPDSQYMTGVGVGGDLDGARGNARAEIAKTFSARVQQASVDTQSESSSSDGSDAAVRSAQETALKTSVSTDELLEGVQIAQTWYDKKAKKHYALAVLDKPKTRRDLSLRIADEEEVVNAQTARGRAAAAPLEKARAYAKAKNAAAARDALVARRRIVDPAGAGADPGAAESSAAIEKALADALGRIAFVVDADGGPDSRLAEAVAGRITALGFKVADSSSAKAADSDLALKVKCRMTIEPYDRGNPSWKFFQWNGTFELAEAGVGGKVLASSAPSGSSGHIVESTALTRTRTDGEETLAKEAAQKISQHIFGE